MDKKVYLLDKERYTAEMVSNLTEKDLEEWLAEEDYNDNYTIVKIDANGYDSVNDALNGEVMWCDLDDYYVFAFGF